MKRKKSVVTGPRAAAPSRLVEARAARRSAAPARSAGGWSVRSAAAVPQWVESTPAVESSPRPQVDLGIDLAPRRPGALVLRNPILVASGTFGYGIEYADVVDVQRLGAICCKGTTLEARVGNPPPRVTETPAGMLNSIGLQNPGVDEVLERYAPLWARWQVPVLVNVAGESIEDYVGVVRKLDGMPGIAGVELNISCPNVGRGGLQFALDREAAGAVTAAVRRATELPLMVKLSPAATDVREIAKAIEGAGADSISAINTLSGMALDRERRRPLLGNTYGGLSGPALKPVGLRVVYEVAQVVAIPIVAIGGVGSLDDVLDYLMAGASAVQVGTAIFADPALPERLIGELQAYCAARGLPSHRDLIGVALPRARVPGGRVPGETSGSRRTRERPSTKGVEYRP